MDRNDCRENARENGGAGHTGPRSSRFPAKYGFDWRIEFSATIALRK